MPRVSIVMAVHNGSAFLAEAVASVLAQTLTEIELVVVDDGSTDASPEILAAVRDSRLRIIRNERNLGLAASLNRGISAAGGPYVARLDADDVCHRDRLRRQAEFLDANARIAILGSAVRVTGAGTPDGTVWPAPRGPLAVRFASMLRTPFFHPTVMIRLAALPEGSPAYDERLDAAQDYDLWARALRSLDGANLREALVTYRLHGDQVTSTRRRLQLETHDEIARRVIARELPGRGIDPDEVTNMRRAFVGGDDGPCDPAAATRSYLDLFEAFAAAHPGDPELREIRREVTARAARVLVSAGRDRGAPRLMARIVRLEPRLPLRALRSVSRRALNKRRGPVC